ncbi:MAG: hypothetical protein HY658_01455, partial [Actinobacteria bacterium]|nr:hypothetical protein [Actinomycetota bacterium]
LAASYFGAYVLARGRALGYDVEESPVGRALRYGLVSAGLVVPGWLEGTLWAVAALAVAIAALRAAQVVKGERA